MTHNKEVKGQYPYAISAKQAVDNLQEFIGAEGKLGTRSESKRKIVSVIPIKHVSTRGQNEIPDCDNLIYVANFENNSGYAILAGDERISEKVLAITEYGNVNGLTANAMTAPSLSTRPVYEGYPTTGAGLFTLEEYGDELFMNPNTVDLHNSTINDTMVGNFDPTIPDDNIIEEDDENAEPYSIPLRLTSELCKSYAARQIIEYDTTMMPNPGDLPIIGIEPGVFEDPQLWVIKEYVLPLLTKYKDWIQDKPFNSMCPKARHFPKLWKRHRAPAGCFPLAVAKVMTYYEFPGPLQHKGVDIDFATINSTYLTHDTIYDANAQNMASALLSYIGKNCNSMYFYSGTFTFPSNVTSFMKWMGFRWNSCKNYKWIAVKNFLDQAKPVIVYACPGINLPKSHAWNIDGYKIMEREVIIKEYDENRHLVNELTRTETAKMVHCDFGWGRTSNGYYVSGIFNNRSSDVEFDYSKGKGKFNYDDFVQIISYNLP